MTLDESVLDDYDLGHSWLGRFWPWMKVAWTNMAWMSKGGWIASGWDIRFPRNRLCLIRLQLSPENKFQHSSHPRRFLHYTLCAFHTSLTLYRLGVTVYAVTHEDLNVATFMCCIILFSSFFALFTCSGSSWTSVELREMLNSWGSVLGSMKRATRESVWKCWTASLSVLNWWHSVIWHIV